MYLPQATWQQLHWRAVETRMGPSSLEGACNFWSILDSGVPETRNPNMIGKNRMSSKGLYS